MLSSTNSTLTACSSASILRSTRFICVVKDLAYPEVLPRKLPTVSNIPIMPFLAAAFSSAPVTPADSSLRLPRVCLPRTTSSRPSVPSLYCAKAPDKLVSIIVSNSSWLEIGDPVLLRSSLISSYTSFWITAERFFSLRVLSAAITASTFLGLFPAASIRLSIAARTATACLLAWFL